ncbi:hypothetical protein HY768_11350 [candidate division TA06 bacterium]|uniref:Uncharacterized protein n=1 Tax=candidate division TA06 bacterium TaxID=2250710 RepID=A0A933MLR5_UNCT6|nr:hypothetical protein [candidate division TA06 bacterium]
MVGRPGEVKQKGFVPSAYGRHEALVFTALSLLFKESVILCVARNMPTQLILFWGFILMLYFYNCFKNICAQNHRVTLPQNHIACQGNFYFNDYPIRSGYEFNVVREPKLNPFASPSLTSG